MKVSGSSTIRSRPAASAFEAIAACVATVLLGTVGLAGPALANDEGAADIREALTKGKPTLNVRGRIEIADQTGRLRSEAYTVRTRLGYGTKPFHGVSIYADFENIAAATATTYFDPTNPWNPWLTTIAEPPATEINQGFLMVDRPDWLGTKAIGGRQSIVLDDSRFIGNVIWRQNEQTYDAAWVQSSAGVDGLTVRYSWIGRVNRIFGGGGTNSALTDFESNSHVVNASFTKFDQARIVGFVYLLDLVLPFQPTIAAQNANSSKTFGGRVTGTLDLTEKLHLLYQGSYAYQSNYGAKSTPYSANYGLVDVGIKYDDLGTLGGGYEHLGTSNGIQQFSTPLATLHKFNGWADVFLNNGGPGGLRDFHAYVAPKLPWKLKMKLVYHRFWSDSNSAVLGNEIDGLIGRPVGKYLDLLFKAAYFDAAAGAPAAIQTTYRVWFDVTVKF